MKLTACRCAFKKIILILLALLLLPIFFLIGHLGYNYFLIDNVHTVIPGKIYRSAQLDKKTLLEYTQKFHFKTYDYHNLLSNKERLKIKKSH